MSGEILYVCNVDDHLAKEDCGAMVSKSLEIPRERLDVVHTVRDESLEVRNHSCILLGGSASNLTIKDAWLARLRERVQEWLDRGIPIFGLCFGTQLIAEMQGGKVEKCPHGRVQGIDHISLNGTPDPILANLPSRFNMITSHGEEITELPPGAVLLGSGERTKNEIIRFNDCVYGTQGHPEMSASVAEVLTDARRELTDDADKRIDEIRKADLKHARQLLRNFVGMYVV